MNTPCTGIVASAAILGALLMPVTASPARAECRTHVAPLMLHVDNDSLTGTRTDGGYTSGVRIAAFGATGAAPAVLDDWVERLAGSTLQTRCLPDGRDGGGQRSVFLHQEIHTPHAIGVSGPQPRDRPWAGLAAVGRGWDVVGLDGGRLVARRIEVALVAVGDASLARQSQELVHEVIDAAKPLGWDNQVRNRIGVEASYLERRRWGTPRYDVIGHAGATLGTIRTHASVGATVRVGDTRCTFATPGQVAHPISVGGDIGEQACGSARRRPHFFAFGGIDLRGVLRNELIDGEPRVGRSEVRAAPWVGEARIGIAYGAPTWSISYLLVRRSNDLDSPPGAPSGVKTFGAAVLSVDWW